MTIEHAHSHSFPKPWGVADLRPWNNAGDGAKTIGEIWYERSDSTAISPLLLLKILFTNQPLSIQVHPADTYAQSIGLPNGKTEAWYVLSAAPDAKVALGLKRRVSPKQLRRAIDDGSIPDLVAWQAAHTGDTIYVAAGAIHAIGAGLVIAEIQQRSDATFRLFDYGRGRELDIENAIAAATAGPADFRVKPTRLTDTRTLLVSNSHFTFERIDLPPNSAWSLEAIHETWLLVVRGSAHASSFDLTTGDAVFAQSDHVNIRVDGHGLAALVAYTGGLVSQLLQCVDMKTTQ
ncbi:MAG TPA: class I mannose-6-phosphate isomerase [Anaerolineae bacterium]|nr:class I mannose-6-phosphate isomerase [Anaerolineae bacterium]